MKAPLPPDEAQRLEALRRYEVLDTSPEEAYDDIVQLAAHICQVPMAMVSLVDKDRQWFKSRIGVSASETTRDIAFCAHTILHKDEMLEVRDAEADPRFSDSALVTSDPHVRFYAGAPLVSPDGHALGALCVMDRVPRGLTEDQSIALLILGRHVVSQLELRRKSRETEGLLAQGDKSRRALLSVLEDEKMAGQNLRESEERFRQLAENIDEVFWLMNPELNEILYVSPAYEKIWGRPCAHLYVSATAWMDPIHPDDREQLHHAWTTKPIENYNEEYRIIKPDGSVAWIHDRAFPVRDAAGKILRIAGVARDITERKLAGERIAEQAALLDQTHDAILVRDLEGRILFWSKGAERLYGFTSDETLGRKAGELLYGGKPAKYNEAHAATITQGEWSGEIEQVVKDGRKITVAARWTLMRDAHGNPKSILAINTDITEKKKIEAQFLRAQRMESIGTLASGIAHDLNNILAPIMMSVELLKSTSTDRRTNSMLETLENCAQRGADIVRQVLSFGRGLEGHATEIQPNHLLKDIQGIIKDTFPKDIRLKFSAAKDGWTIRGDPTQLHQILLNLSVNARDAMPHGGELTMNVENRTLDEQYAAMNPQAKNGDYVVISVTDTGTGIPQDILDKIFDPFFTTKEIGKGTGLGLSTVQGIVKSHDGFLNVYSEPGKGTTFRVHFPAIIASKAGEEQETQASLPRGNGETVLLIDDEASILTITSQTLEAFGYRTLTANNGAAAVAVYAQHHNEIAVVLTDMMMPVMDGRATIHALGVINPEVKIIAASGLDANGNMTGAAGAGVKHFLAKPYNARTLLETLRAVLDGK